MRTLANGGRETVRVNCRGGGGGGGGGEVELGPWTAVGVEENWGKRQVER